jgi:hypothetical protein
MAEGDVKPRAWLEQNANAERLLAAARRDAAPPELAARLLDHLNERNHNVRAAPGGDVAGGPELPGLEPPGSPVAAADPWGLPSPRGRRLVGAVLGFALAAAALVALVQRSLPAGKGLVVAEARRAAPAPVSRPSAPCPRVERARLERPIIDDFEDGNTRIAAYDGRSGYWQLITASDPPEAKSPLLVPRDMTVGGVTTKVLHVTTPKRPDWGVSLATRLGPPCYDLSAFRGVHFRARGPARISAHVQMHDVIPREFGGSCDSECYLDHERTFELSSEFTRYDIGFEELSRKPPVGNEGLAFDARRVHSLSFTLAAEDTPAEFWLDDVALTP